MVKPSLAALLVTCAVVTAIAQAPAPPEGYPAVGAPAALRVLSTGSAPRSQLRYAVPNGHRARARVTTETAMTMSMQGMTMPQMQLPTLVMDAAFSVTNVSASGDMTFSFVFDAIDIEGSGPAADAVRTGIGDLKGLGGSAVVSNRGITRQMQLDFSKVTSPQMREALGSTSQSIQNISVPLPEDAVGPGARWEVRQALATGGIQVYQRTEVELVTSDGRLLTLKLIAEQTAPPQALVSSQFPAGSNAKLQKMESRSTGTATIRLAELVPTSDIEVRSTSTMELTMNGSAMPINAENTARVRVAPLN